MESFLSPSPFAWALGIELRSPSLFIKPIYFYPVNHLKLQTLFEVLGSQACAATPGKVHLLVKGCVL